MYGHVQEHGDPIFQPAPKDRQVVPGVMVLLYSRNHAQRVARGVVEQYAGAKWGRLSMSTAQTARVVVRITHAERANAFLQHPPVAGGAKQTLAELMQTEPALALWDVAHLRLANSYVRPQALPAEVPPSTADAAAARADRASGDSEAFFADNTIVVPQYVQHVPSGTGGASTGGENAFPACEDSDSECDTEGDDVSSNGDEIDSRGASGSSGLHETGCRWEQGARDSNSGGGGSSGGSNNSSGHVVSSGGGAASSSSYSGTAATTSSGPRVADDTDSDGGSNSFAGATSATLVSRAGGSAGSTANVAPVPMDCDVVAPAFYVPEVRLDAIHAMRRISRTLKQSHGAFSPFVAMLRDAFFIVSDEDVKAVDAYLSHCGLSAADITKFKAEHWKFYLKHCRRHIPEAGELLRRFKRVCNAFGHVVDAVLGEPLFRAAAWKAVSLDTLTIMQQFSC